MYQRSVAVPVRSWFTALLLLFLSADVVWMLSMPAWPSQDGPVHLYYTQVLDALFSHGASPFRSYFFIKHLLPPYALYYYTLLLLSHVVPLLVADRVVICLYMVSFVLGFRYAARALGANAGLTTLLASVLVLNWALGMGFTNYCMSLSFALWAIGLWLRIGDGRELRRRIGFFALLVLITLTHPVPLLIVLAFGGLELVCRFLAIRGEAEPIGRGHRRGLVYAALTLASSLFCIAYVKAFTVAHPLAQRTAETGSFASQVVRRIKDILIVKNVELLYGGWWQVQVYRCALGAILLGAALMATLAFVRNRRTGIWRSSDTAFVFALCVTVVVPLLPSDLSGAYYFTERLDILLWISMLLAASGWRRAAETQGTNETPAAVSGFRGRMLSATGWAGAVCATLLTALLLHAANAALRPIAEHDWRLAHVQLPLEGRLTMVLDGGKPRKYIWAGPPWDPYFWDTVALLRRNDGIMVNAPWLDSPIIPLAEVGSQPGSVLSPKLANSPLELGDALEQRPALRSDVLDRSQVALFSPVRGVNAHGVPQLLGSGWACEEPRGEGFRLCVHEEGTVARGGEGVSGAYPDAGNLEERFALRWR